MYNLLYVYGRYAGPAIFLAVVGFLWIMLKNKELDRKVKYGFLTVCMFSVPFAIVGVYAALIIIPIICLLGGIGTGILLIKFLRSRKLRAMAVPLGVTLLLISGSMTLYISSPNINPHLTMVSEGWMVEETYELSAYLNSHASNSNFLSPWVTSEQVTFLTDRFTLPTRDIDNLIFSCVSTGDLKISTVLSPIDMWKAKGIFKLDTNQQRQLDTVNTGNYVLNRNIDTAGIQQTLAKYNIHYYIQFEYPTLQYQKTNFCKSIEPKRYVIYQNDMYRVWFIMP